MPENGRIARIAACASLATLAAACGAATTIDHIPPHSPSR